MTLRAPLFGVWAPACTPIRPDGAPDPARLAEHAGTLLANGCHGVVLFGTTGEAVSFSVEERVRTLDAVLETGVEAGRLIVGTGAAALTDASRLTAHATDCGCAGALLLPPFYYKRPSSAGLARFYSAVIEAAARLPTVVLYHFPKLSTVPISHELVSTLLERFPGAVAGLKDSTGDLESAGAFIRAFPELAVFPGTEVLLADLLGAGAAGCITATANVNAPAIRGLYDALRAGDPDRVERSERVAAVRACIQAYPAIPALKHILATRNRDATWRSVRPPLEPLGPDDSRRLMADLAATDLMVEPVSSNPTSH